MFTTTSVVTLGNEHATAVLPTVYWKIIERYESLIPNRIGLDDMGRKKMSCYNALDS